MSARTDVELVSAVAARDVAAFAELYDRHAPRLYALCLRMLRSMSDAEEVLQDAFLQAWQHANRFDPSRGSAKAWLVVITRSRAVDRLRASSAVLGHADEHGLPDQPGCGRGPEGQAIEQEEALRVRRQVEALPGAQRVPLELAFYEGLTHVEIATVLRQPLGTVKTRIRLALLKLRDRSTEAAPPLLREPSPFTLALSQYLAARVSVTPPSPLLEGVTVMVVDDDHDTLDLVRIVLESAGARVVSGSSAPAALAQLNESWPDVMLTDIRMPGVDGYSLAEEIQSVAQTAARTLPVVAFTAYDRDIDVENAPRAKFAAYLAKPTPPRRVIETVAQVCGRIL